MGNTEAGSHTIEGIVSIGVFFLLLMLIVQIGFLLLARSAAATSVEGALRKAAIGVTSASEVRRGLIRDVTAIVPGAEGVQVDVTWEEQRLRATVTFRWIPPGPDFVPLTIGIERSVARVVPP